MKLQAKSLHSCFLKQGLHLFLSPGTRQGGPEGLLSLPLDPLTHG